LAPFLLPAAAETHIMGKPSTRPARRRRRASANR
jgi:hypothetical protein